MLLMREKLKEVSKKLIVLKALSMDWRINLKILLTLINIALLLSKVVFKNIQGFNLYNFNRKVIKKNMMHSHKC